MITVENKLDEMFKGMTNQKMVELAKENRELKARIEILKQYEPRPFKGTHGQSKT